jgi:hypothetical protein
MRIVSDASRSRLVLLVILTCVLGGSCGMIPGEDDFDDCAPEGELCACSGLVRFGTDDAFADKCVLGGPSESGIICSQSEFGDPAPGRPNKYCRCAQVECVADSERGGTGAGRGASARPRGSPDCLCVCGQGSIEFECSQQQLCLDSVTVGGRGSHTSCPAEDVVMRCASDGGGTFLLRTSAPHLSAFVRISGPTLDTVLFDKMEGACGLWSAEYLYCGGGSYHASVYTLFKDSSPLAAMQGESCLIKQISENPFKHVKGLRNYETLVDLQEPVSMTWWEDGERTPNANCSARWRWPSDAHADGMYEAQKRALSRYTTQWKYLMHEAFHSGDDGLYGRRLNAYHPSALRDLIPPAAREYQDRAVPMLARIEGGAERFCFVGDSNMRNLLNSVIALMTGSLATGAAERAQAEKKVLEVIEVPADMLYIKMHMPNDWCGFDATAETAKRWLGFPPFDPLDACAQQNETQHPGPVELGSCVHILFNIGQWPLCAGWSTDEYEHGMRIVLTQLAHYSALNKYHNHQVPVTVLATNPYPLRNILEERRIECTSDCPGPLETCPMHPAPDEETCPHTGWAHEPCRRRRPIRFPHLIAAYNEIAQRVVHALGSPSVRFLDTWPTAFALSDMSFDAAHYQGLVGKGLAMVAPCLSLPPSLFYTFPPSLPPSLPPPGSFSEPAVASSRVC